MVRFFKYSIKRKCPAREHAALSRVKEHWPQRQNILLEQVRYFPDQVVRAFEDSLKCGRLEHGFLRVRCASCHHGKRVAFSCKRRGFCLPCGPRRMADSAAHWVDEGLPKRPMRQGVLECTVPLDGPTHSRPIRRS